MGKKIVKKLDLRLLNFLSYSGIIAGVLLKIMILAILSSYLQTGYPKMKYHWMI
jgi:hypothetical protein